MTEDKETNARRIPTRQILFIGFSFVVGFIILGVIAIPVSYTHLTLPTIYSV